jgi:hypothetical protein
MAISIDDDSHSIGNSCSRNAGYECSRLSPAVSNANRVSLIGNTRVPDVNVVIAACQFGARAETNRNITVASFIVP